MLQRLFGKLGGKSPVAPMGQEQLWQMVLWALIGAACAYRVWIIVAFNPMDHIWSDPQRHWEQGTDFQRDDPIALMDPIIFQLYVGIIAKLTLGRPELVAFYTALLSLLTPYTWYRFLRELLPSKTLALLGCALIAWLPSWTAIYSYFMQETLMLPLLGASLWATWRCRRKQTTTSFMLACTLWTIAGLTRAICLPMGLVALIWVWLEQGERLRRVVLGLGLLIVAFGPLTWRMMERAHIIAPHGIGYLNELYARSGAFEINIEFEREGAGWGYGFGSPSVGAEPFQPFSDWKTHREGIVKYRVDLDEGARDWRASAATIDMSLEKYLWLTGENLIFLFFSESWPDTDRDRTIGEINYQLRWLWAPLALACIVLTVVCWRRQRERLLPAIMLTWFVLQGLALVSVNEGRYRKPIEGLLIAQTLLVAASLRRREAPANGKPAANGKHKDKERTA